MMVKCIKCKLKEISQRIQVTTCEEATGYLPVNDNELDDLQIVYKLKKEIREIF